MDFYNGLALCLGIQALATMVPGQNHFMLLSISPSGRAALAMAVLGITSAGIVFSVGVVLSTLLGRQAKAEVLFSTFNIIGSLYLIYLGIKLVLPFLKSLQFNSDRKAQNSSRKNNLQNQMPLYVAFRNGFLINISNAKSILFFVNIFSTTLPLHNMTTSHLTISIVFFYLNLILFHGIVAFIFTIRNIQAIVLKWSDYIAVIAGSVFVTFGCFSAFIAINSITS